MFMLNISYYEAQVYGYLLVIVASIFMMIAQGKVQSAYRKYSKVENEYGYTGYQVARSILDKNGLQDVEIQCVKGQLSDHYDPRKKVVNLSDEIFNGTSIASVSVAAHEVGHALQDAQDYGFLRFRNSILPIANIGSTFGWIAIMAGLILGAFDLAMIGIVLMCGMLLFQVVTLPVEFDASNRALSILEENYINSNEVAMSKSMLSAAALTYVASAAATLASILRLLMIILSSNNRRR